MFVLHPSRLVWRKSSLSGAGQDCVEVARADSSQAVPGHTADVEHLFLVRDSKDPDGPVLSFTPSEWAVFFGRIKGEGFIDLV